LHHYPTNWNLIGKRRNHIIKENVEILNTVEFVFCIMVFKLERISLKIYILNEINYYIK